MLGYELGDLHHKANLNDLAVRFGLRFHTDIVAPAGWKPEKGKPYGRLVKLEQPALSGQALLAGVKALEW